MTDRFQLTEIIATAIRTCRVEAASQQDAARQEDANDMEQAHCAAKAVLTAIADAGYEITPKQAN